jgi:hypothetical protein
VYELDNLSTANLFRVARMDRKCTVHVCHSKQMSPKPSKVVRISCPEEGRSAVIHQVPWAGLSFVSFPEQIPRCVRQILLSLDFGVENSIQTCMEYYPSRSQRFSSDDIIRILQTYKKQECSYRCFAGEILVFRNKTITFIDANRSVVVLFGCPWTFISASNFIAGVFAMIVRLD